MSRQDYMQSNDNCITLKGSTDIVVEFFQYSINSILYQRGIYPPEKFTPTKHYNLQMMIKPMIMLHGNKKLIIHTEFP